MTKDIKVLEEVLGTGVSLLLSEHFFSTMLSSPWSTQKFVQTEEDRAMVRKLLLISTIISLATSGIVSWVTKEKWPIVFTFLLCLFYIIIYELALDGDL